MTGSDECSDRPEASDAEPAAGTSRRALVLTGSLVALSAATSGCALLAEPPPVSQAVDPTPPSTALPRGRLEGKVALVTGAARGIGRAISLACAREGADVVGLDIAGPVSPAVRYPPATPADLAETEGLVQAQQGRFLSVIADVRDAAAMREAVRQTVATFGQLDVLVANAGIYVPLSLSQMTDQAWRDVIEVNLTGAGNAMRAVIPHMTERQEGRIVAVSSVLGRIGAPIGPQYNASKWGLIGLVKSAALELGPSGITVNAVCPTAVNTVMLRNDFQYEQTLPWPGQPPERLVAAASRLVHPLGVPFVEPEDVAAVVIFLASDQARFVSGATYDVSAGISGVYTA